MHAQHDDGCLRLRLLDLHGCFDAIQVGHADVHHDDCGLQLGGERHGLAAVVRFAYDLHIGLLFQNQAKAGPDHLVVVGQ